MSRFSRTKAGAAVLPWMLVCMGCADNCDSWSSPDPKSTYCEEDSCVDPPPDCSGEIPATAIYTRLNTCTKTCNVGTGDEIDLALK